MTLLILYGALALVVSSLCSLLEASLLSVPRSYVESLIERGSRSGRAIKSLKQNIDRPLAAILTLNTIAHTIGAAGVGAQAAYVFGDTAVGVASAIMTLAILVFSEIIPKTLGAVHARSLVGVTAWLTRGMIVVCFPIIVALEWVNRLVGYKGHTDRTSRMDVLATIRLGREGGSLDDREYRIAANLMALSDIAVLEILTPRTVVFGLPAGTTVAEVLAEHHPLRFSRIPTYDGVLDNVTGYVTRFEIHEAAAAGRDAATLADLAQPILTLPQQATATDALQQMLDGGEQIALIVDEYGGTEGIVTLEDVIETLLGQEITDDTDPASDMQALARRKRRRPKRPKES